MICGALLTPRFDRTFEHLNMSSTMEAENTKPSAPSESSSSSLTKPESSFSPPSPAISAHNSKPSASQRSSIDIDQIEKGAQESSAGKAKPSVGHRFCAAVSAVGYCLAFLILVAIILGVLALGFLGDEPAPPHDNRTWTDWETGLLRLIHKYLGWWKSFWKCYMKYFRE
jgi:hypothetical protein